MICKDTLIFSDKFETNIDESRWTIENKYPSDQQVYIFSEISNSKHKFIIVLLASQLNGNKISPQATFS